MFHNHSKADADPITVSFLVLAWHPCMTAKRTMLEKSASKSCFSRAQEAKGVLTKLADRAVMAIEAEEIGIIGDGEVNWLGVINGVTQQITQTIDIWTSEMLVAYNAAVDNAVIIAQDEPLKLVIDEVSKEQIIKSRAKFLFSTFCVHARTSTFHGLYQVAFNLRDDCVMLSMGKTWTDSSRSELAKVNNSMESIEELCANLTAMVALWRTLQAGETRATLSERTLSNLATMKISPPLKSLLKQCAEGRGSYVTD